MSIPVSSYAGAVAAYQRAATATAGDPPQTVKAETAAGVSFADLVKTAAEGAMATAKAGEAASVAGLQGRADISEVVTAVAEAELTLQTVIAIRDKALDAYHDIIRMPI
jgi:flagellar hook-basal body complex protein FliE